MTDPNDYNSLLDAARRSERHRPRGRDITPDTIVIGLVMVIVLACFIRFLLDVFSPGAVVIGLACAAAVLLLLFAALRYACKD